MRLVTAPNYSVAMKHQQISGNFDELLADVAAL